MLSERAELDYRLLRAIRNGIGELPGDLVQLRDYMRTVGELLAEKAAELEPSWDEAVAAAAEIATLQELEATIVERAIGVPAESLKDVRAKLTIWRALAAGCDEGEMETQLNRLVLSIEADLERVGRSH